MNNKKSLILLASVGGVAGIIYWLFFCREKPEVETEQPKPEVKTETPE